VALVHLDVLLDAAKHLAEFANAAGGADNITVDLNGHRVSGAGPGDGSHPGILIDNHTGVTVTGGQSSTISGFDEGVAIIGGSHNTVSFLSVRDNVGPQTTDSVYGDGIGIFFSPGNTVANVVRLPTGVARPDVQKDFKAKYNRDLAVPKTLDELHDIAQFRERLNDEGYASVRILPELVGCRDPMI